MENANILYSDTRYQRKHLIIIRLLDKLYQDNELVIIKIFLTKQYVTIQHKGTQIEKKTYDIFLIFNNFFWILN